MADQASDISSSTPPTSEPTAAPSSITLTTAATQGSDEASTALTRRSSQETLASSPQTLSDATTVAVHVPPAPAPSVASASLSNERFLQELSKRLADLSIPATTSLLRALQLPDDITTEVIAEKNEDEGINRSRSTSTMRRLGDITPPEQHVHEHENWLQYALEDVDKGVKRLITAAKDLEKIKGEKSAEAYYSENLAAILREQEFEFEVGAMGVE